MISIRFSTLALLALAALLLGTATQAAIITVTSSSTPGCTLHDAIRAANADAARGDCSAGSGVDTIRIVPGTIDLPSTPQTIDSTIIIESSNASTKTIRRPPGANNTYRVLDVNNGNLTLRRVQISGGHLRGTLDGGGAGIRARDSNLTLDHAVVSGNVLENTNDSGGGIYAESSVVSILDSRVQFNQLNADQAFLTRGAGIGTSNSDVVISRSTFVGQSSNTSMYRFGGGTTTIQDSYFDYAAVSPQGAANSRYAFYFSGGTVEFINTTIDSNASNSALPILESSGTFGTLRFRNSTLNRVELNSPRENIIPVELVNTILVGECDDDTELLVTSSIISSATCDDVPTLGPQLYPVADNGGPTLTMALHPYSNAINAGDNSQCPPADQRGQLRTNGCDIGAFEFVASADVQLTSSIQTPAPTYAGQPVRINLALSNPGPDTAHAVFVDLSLTNATVQSVDGACSTIPCTLFSLVAGAPARTISVVVTPTSNPPNSFSYLASATRASNSPYVETNIGNNSASGNRALSLAADLAISKTLLTSGPYTVGQTVNYQLRVDNLGPNNIFSGLVVSDTPSGLNITGISGCQNQPAGPCGFTSLNAGSSITLNVTAQVTAANFDNVAEVTSNTFDPDTRNNIDERLNAGSATATADIAVSMLLQTPPPRVRGQLVNYLVRVSNNGPSPATGVRMDFDAAAAEFFVTGLTGSCSPLALPCELGSLGSGQSTNVIVQGLLPFSGPVSVQATAQAEQTDGSLGNNTASDSFVVQQSADLQASLTRLTPADAFVGQAIVYRLIVSNFGDDDADDVAITVASQNLQIVSATGGHCTSLPCSISTLSLLENETIEIVAQASAPGFFDLSASVSSTQIDPVPGNNVDADGNSGTAVRPERGAYVFGDSFETF